MIDRPSNRTLIGVFLVCLILVSVSGPVVADSTIYGLSVGEAILLFGNGQPTHDEQPFTTDDLDEVDTSTPISAEEILSNTTVKWDEPPESPGTWNSNNFDEEVASTRSTSNSISLNTSTVKNSNYIKHAHGTIHSLTPSTVAHYSNETVRYVAEDGTVRSKVDFLVVVPEDDYDPNPPGENTLSIRWEYTLQQAEVTEYELVVDGTVVDSVSGTNDPSTHVSGATFDYSDIPEDTDSIQVRATIQSSIEEKITTRSREYYTDEDGERKSRTVTETSYNTLSDSVTVSDGYTVAVEQIDQTEVTIFELPDGSTTTVVDSPHIFSGFEIGGQTAPDGFWAGLFSSQEDKPPDEVHTGWKFISIRDVGWDQGTKASESGESVSTQQYNSPVIPVEKHVYPSGHSPQINRTGDGDVAYPESVEVMGETDSQDSPELPPNTSVYLTGKYRNQTSLKTVHRRDVTGEDTEVYGIAETDPATIPASEISTETVEESNLTMTFEGINGSRDRPTKVTITLRSNATGQLVDHTEAGGEVLLSDYPTDRSVDLGEDGRATVLTNKTGTVKARYEPPAWTDSNEPLTADREYIQANTLPGTDTFLGWLANMVVALTPIFVALWVVSGVRKMLDYRTLRQR